MNPSILQQISALTDNRQALNLGSSRVHFPLDAQLTELINLQNCKQVGGYMPLAGAMPLREQLTEQVLQRHGTHYQAETEICITSDGTNSIRTIMQAFINPGDEVILFEPSYQPYTAVVLANGGVLKALELAPPDYRIHWDMVKSLLSNKTKMIIINSPQNPTGSTLRPADLDALLEITRNTNIIVFSDEVCEHILFDDSAHRSVANLPELAARSIIMGSFGKTFHSKDWKTGYLLAPAYLMEQIHGLQNLDLYDRNNAVQYALAKYIANNESYDRVRDLFQKKRDYFARHMLSTRFDLIPTRGGFFQTAYFNRISDERDHEFCLRLCCERGLATIPLSPYYQRNLDFKVILFCFARPKDTIDRALEILTKL